MRTRPILSALILAMACCAPVAGCQIIAGITALEVTDGGGGSSSAGTGPAVGSSTGGPPPQCMPNMPCGGTCVGNAVVPPGTCTSAGMCPGQPKACGQGMLCLPGPTPTSASMCKPCGTVPGKSMCMGCASCGDAGDCVTTCDGGPCGDGNKHLSLDATMTTAKLVCNGPGACDHLTIECQGPFPCELVCNGGCGMGTTFKCGDGPCTLTCGAKSCMNVTQACGNNACTASCVEMAHVDQICAGPCACTKSGPGSMCQ